MAAKEENPRQSPPPPAIAAGAAAGPAPSGRSLTRPPTPRARLAMWLLLLACLALAAPAMLVDIPHQQVTNRAEAYTLLVSRQTIEHYRQSAGGGYSFEAFVPYLNGQPQWQLPPGLPWMHLLALSRMDLAAGQVDWFVSVSRLLSVGMGLLTVAAVFWAALSIGGTRTGVIAGMVCATNPVFIYQARLASPPIFYAGWSLLSIAAALWALRPLKPPPSVARQAIGWAICGLALGMAVLTSGPGSLLGVMLPILLLLLLCPDRASHLLGLLAALLIGVLLFLPWAAYAHQQDPEAWPLDWVRWIPLNWLSPERLAQGAGERLGLLGVVLLPWTLWVVGAMAQPFSTSSAGVRVRLFLGWGWFILVLAFYMVVPAGLPAAGREACLLAAVAAAAVLIAEVFNQYVDLAEHGRAARFWRLLRLPHLALLTLSSAAIPIVLGVSPWQGPLGGPQAPLFADLGWPFAIGLSLALLGIVGLSLRWVIHNFPAKALGVWAIWGAVFLTAAVMLLSRGPFLRSPTRAEAGLLSVLIDGQPVYWWGGPKTDPAKQHAPLLLYMGRTVPVLTTDRIESARQELGFFYLLAPVRSPQLPLPFAGQLIDSPPASGILLYRCEGKTAPTTAPVNLPGTPTVRD